MTKVEDLVSGQVASVQDALAQAGEHMRRHVSRQNVAASQRAVARVQEALAVLSVGLCDSDVPGDVDGTLEEAA